MSRKRWSQVADRKAALAPMQRGRILAVARRLDPDGALGLVQRANALLDAEAGGAS